MVVQNYGWKREGIKFYFMKKNQIPLGLHGRGEIRMSGHELEVDSSYGCMRVVVFVSSKNPGDFRQRFRLSTRRV